MAPVQCQGSPEGRNGLVIYENSSYSLALLDTHVEDHGHQNSVYGSQELQQTDTALRAPVQCQGNPEGRNGLVIYENSSYSLALLDTHVEDHGHQNSVYGSQELQQTDTALRTPVQCEENPEGQSGYIICDSGSHSLQHNRGRSERFEPHHNNTPLREDQHVLYGLMEHTVNMQPHVERERIYAEEDLQYVL